MDNVWLVSSLWLALALLAALVSIRIAISVALVEIIVGMLAGNLFGLAITPWASYLAGAGAIALTFLAGAEIDPGVVRRHFKPSVTIGLAVFLLVKMATKFVGIWPLTKTFSFGNREAMYTTLLMSTGLTFRSICALFGLSNHIINQAQYTALVTAVIGSAVVPTLIAQRWFQPKLPQREEGDENA